jgi:hypothetical protein
LTPSIPKVLLLSLTLYFIIVRLLAALNKKNIHQGFDGMSSDRVKFQHTGRVNFFLHLIGVAFLKLLGWKVEGTPPSVPKYIVIVAPHTSNWDYPIALAISWYFRMKGAWLGKSDVFNWPILKYIFKKTGGIPVYRGTRQGLVEQAVEVFEQREELILALTPEGTRAKVVYWKAGFYRIALAAGVPISLGYLDFKRKAGGFGPLYYCTGDQEEDLAFIRSFFDTVTPRHPSLRSEVRFKSGQDNGIRNSSDFQSVHKDPDTP